ncbi:MAG TPA: hypothetical protein VM099_06275 [Gemmatimonadaceae bacterium]|nr:hypothetical protein [Gemmatimonadaceae bacterium]
MKISPLLSLIVFGCAHAGASSSVASPPKVNASTSFEMSGDIVDVDDAVLAGSAPSGEPCTSARCAFQQMSSDESTAFQSEAARLQSHSDPKCQLLGAAMKDQLPNVRIFDKAIVRYVGAYTFYGAGFSYKQNGEWKIGVARRFDDLNPRTIADETRTLRHEMAHTLGAGERRTSQDWSARDYADRCD